VEKNPNIHRKDVTGRILSCNLRNQQFNVEISFDKKQAEWEMAAADGCELI